ncbi:FACT complex subunit SSRP1 [Entamoeba marina]
MEYNAKGFNWGSLIVNKDTVSLTNDGLLILKTNSKDIMKCSISNKTEVSLEFDDSKEGDALSEIKLFQPQTETTTLRDSAQELYEEIEEVTPKNISGKELCVFENIAFLSPKGHYDVKVYEDSVRIQNKTYDYKINFKDVSMFYQLKKDEDSSFFVFRLSNPLKKGQSIYECLVMELSANEMISTELNMSEDFAATTKLDKKMNEPELELLVELFTKLCQVKLVSSGQSYKSGMNHFLRCNLSANEGYLYPLSNTFIFVFKRIRIIPFSAIKSVDIFRMGVGNETGRGNALQFSGVNRSEYDTLVAYLQQSNLHLDTNLKNVENKMEEIDSGDDDEEYMEEEGASGDDDIMSESDD